MLDLGMDPTYQKWHTIAKCALTSTRLKCPKREASRQERPIRSNTPCVGDGNGRRTGVNLIGRWALLLRKRPEWPVLNELILPVAVLESALHYVQDALGAAKNVEMLVHDRCPFGELMIHGVERIVEGCNGVVDVVAAGWRYRLDLERHIPVTVSDMLVPQVVYELGLSGERG